jgi:hypothetical protein
VTGEKSMDDRSNKEFIFTVSIHHQSKLQLLLPACWDIQLSFPYQTDKLVTRRKTTERKASTI